MFHTTLFILSVTGSPACYKTKSGECVEHLSQGDCGDGEWLVPGEGGVLECQERHCHPQQVLIDGECLDIGDPYVCTGAGEEISVDGKGEVSCQCEDGWSRSKTSDNPPVNQGECVKDITDADYEDFEYDDDNAVLIRVPRDDYELGTPCTGKNCCGPNRIEAEKTICPRGKRCEKKIKCYPCSRVSTLFSRGGVRFRMRCTNKTSTTKKPRTRG